MGGLASFVCIVTTTLTFVFYSITGFCRQQECSKPTQNVMIELYCCGPGLLFWLLSFQNKEGSWVFKVLLQRFCKTLYSRLQKSCNRHPEQQKQSPLKAATKLVFKSTVVMEITLYCCKISAICCTVNLVKLATGKGALVATK